MSRNGRHASRRPRLEMRHSAASPEETAAIAAAIEQFLRDTSPPLRPPRRPVGWARDAILDGAGLPSEARSPWGDPEPWGR